MRLYPSYLISKAKDLRSQGFTYREICQNLGEVIPKSTLNGWVKDITPPAWYQNKIQSLVLANIKRIHKLSLIQNKALLDARLNNLHIKNSGLINHIDHNVAIIILSILYWCEGAKYPSHSGIRFGSSDPEMIRLFIVLLRVCYPLDENKFRLTVQCRADQDVVELTSYWQDITQIPPTKTYHAQIDKRSIGIPTKKLSYKGVCVVEYLDSNLQCELQFLGKSLGTVESTYIMKNQIK